MTILFICTFVRSELINGHLDLVNSLLNLSEQATISYRLNLINNCTEQIHLNERVSWLSCFVKEILLKPLQHYDCQVNDRIVTWLWRHDKIRTPSGTPALYTLLVLVVYFVPALVPLCGSVQKHHKVLPNRRTLPRLDGLRFAPMSISRWRDAFSSGPLWLHVDGF